MKRVIKIAMIIICFCFIAIQSEDVQAAKLSASRQKRADQIYKIMGNPKSWKKYGCLPSVCIAQGIIESGLGEKCRSNNYWGLRCGRASYSSLKNGVKAYMQCINNGYYKGAPYKKNYATQIDKILDGGYCQPRGSYYSKAVSVIRSYKLYNYDKKLFKQIKKEKLEKKRKREEAKRKREEEKRRREEEKKRRELQKQLFTFVYNPALPFYSLDVDKKIVPQGVILVGNYLLRVTHEAATGSAVYIGIPAFDNKQMHFTKVWENAVG